LLRLKTISAAYTFAQRKKKETRKNEKRNENRKKRKKLTRLVGPRTSFVIAL